MLKYWEIVNKATGDVVYSYESESKQIFGGDWGKEDLFENKETNPPTPSVPPFPILTPEEVLTPLVAFAQLLVDKGIVTVNELPQQIQDEMAP
jgi:hypothetical protein